MHRCLAHSVARTYATQRIRRPNQLMSITPRKNVNNALSATLIVLRVRSPCAK